MFNGNPQFTRPFDNGDNVNFSINGGLRQTNSYLLDGTPDEAVTDTAGDRTRGNHNIAYIPTVDAVQEFRDRDQLLRCAVRAYRRRHHQRHHKVRRKRLPRHRVRVHAPLPAGREPYPNNANGRPRYGVDPVTKENLGGHKLDQYGTHLTGPVRIPKVYDGRNKTFFSFGFENYVESTPSQLTYVPSLAMRQGDFSGVGVTISIRSPPRQPEFRPARARVRAIRTTSATSSPAT